MYFCRRRVRRLPLDVSSFYKTYSAQTADPRIEQVVCIEIPTQVWANPTTERLPLQRAVTAYLTAPRRTLIVVIRLIDLHRDA